MFKKKSFIGMMVDEDVIKLMRVIPKRKSFIVDAVRTVDIAELVAQPEKNKVLETAEVGSDDVFGLEEELSGDVSITQETASNGAETEQKDLSDDDLELDLGLDDEDWMSTTDQDQADDVKTRIVFELLSVLHEMGGKKVELGMIIPAGRTLFHSIELPDDIKSQRKVRAFVKERMEAVYNLTDLKEDDYRYIQHNKKQVLVASCQESTLLMDLYDRLNVLEPQTFFLRSFLPEEAALMEFIPESKADAEGSTVLISLGKSGARILFAKNGMIQSAMPVIAMKNAGNMFVNKVFSRIMMELEKGQINYVNRFVIHDTVGIGQNLADVLDKNFESIDSQLLTKGSNILVNLPTVEDEEPEPLNLSILSGAITASGRNSTLTNGLNFVPKAVMDRQKVFKLKWHGVILLMLIALAPLAVNQVYKEISTESEILAQSIERQTQQITELQQISDGVATLDQLNAALSAQLLQMDNLSSGTLLWTGTLNILSSGLPDIRNTWITSLHYNNGNLLIEGSTLYRDRVPMVANLFHDAGIQQVTSTEIRERTVFNFLITVQTIARDESIFNPQVTADENFANGANQ